MLGKIKVGINRLFGGKDEIEESKEKTQRRPQKQSEKPVNKSGNEQKSRRKNNNKPREEQRSQRSQRTSRSDDGQRTSDGPRSERRSRARDGQRAERRSGSQSRRRPPRTQAVANRYNIAPKEIPQKPAQLKDIEKQEGKVRFIDLPIHEDIQFGIQDVDFEYCSPIQALTFPPLFEGRDIVARAQTGTGKTAAFLISTFTTLLNNPPANERKNGQPRAIVLAPTRELAIQIHKDGEALGKYCNLNSLAIFGGMNHERQRHELNTEVDVVIGTPGRIIDFSRGSSLDLSKVEVLIIDEADRMLDMGFIPDVRRIVSQMPGREERQTMLFSATIDDDILKLSSSLLENPVMLESEPEQMVSDDIEQFFYSVSRTDKLALLLHFINSKDFERMLVFGNRKAVNMRLQRELRDYGIDVPILSGDITQNQRIKILERFRTGEEKIIIATDVASRGIHVDDVSVVVNYDLPERAEDYVHRIGRTGRAGNKGKAVSFLCEFGAQNLPDIEKLLDERFNSEQPTEDMLVLPKRVARTRTPRQRPNRRCRGRAQNRRG